MFDPSPNGEVYRGNAFEILGSIKKSYAWIGG